MQYLSNKRDVATVSTEVLQEQRVWVRLVTDEARHRMTVRAANRLAETQQLTKEVCK